MFSDFRPITIERSSGALRRGRAATATSRGLPDVSRWSAVRSFRTRVISFRKIRWSRSPRQAARDFQWSACDRLPCAPPTVRVSSHRCSGGKRRLETYRVASVDGENDPCDKFCAVRGEIQRRVRHVCRFTQPPEGSPGEHTFLARRVVLERLRRHCRGDEPRGDAVDADAAGRPLHGQ